MATVSFVDSSRDHSGGWWQLVVIASAGLLGGMSYVASTNRYVAMFGSEMAGAYDCDGPTSVLIFLVPAAVLAIIGIVLSGRALRRGLDLTRVVTTVAAVVVATAVLARVPSVIAEYQKNLAVDSPCR